MRLINNDQIKQKINLIQGLIGVDDNVNFGNTTFTPNDATLHGTHNGAAVHYHITSDQILLLERADSVDAIIDVYDTEISNKDY